MAEAGSEGSRAGGQPAAPFLEHGPGCVSPAFQLAPRGYLHGTQTVGCTAHTGIPWPGDEWDLCVPVVRPSQTSPAAAWAELRLARGGGRGWRVPDPSAFSLAGSENAFV